MNEEHKKRGFASSKTLMAAAICALFLGGGSVMAHAAEAPIVQEQQQTMNVTIKVLDPTGEPIIGANVIQRAQRMVALQTLTVLPSWTHLVMPAF